MFTHIIDTPSKTRLATFFLVAAPRSFHPEEVRKAVGEPGAVVAATLKHFVKQGFLKHHERRGEVYYQVNLKYPYYDEVKSFLVKRPMRVRDEVSRELERLNNAALVVLTGLFTGVSRMPTDLVVVGRPTPSSLKRAVDAVEKEMRQEIFYTLFTEDEFNDRLSMYERFTRDLFENPHVVVADRRVKAEKKPLAAKKKVKR